MSSCRSGEQTLRSSCDLGPQSRASFVAAVSDSTGARFSASSPVPEWQADGRAPCDAGSPSREQRSFPQVAVTRAGQMPPVSARMEGGELAADVRFVEGVEGSACCVAHSERREA